MSRLERPSWFAAGAGAMGLAAMLAVDIPDRESASPGDIVVRSQVDALVVRQLEQINARLARLEPAPASAAAAAEAPPTEAGPKARPEAYEASMDAGRDIVDRAIQAGSWTHKDVAAFGAATASLDMPDRLAIHQRLILAINEDRVQLQGPAWQR
jgi:hypothetical protein